MHQGTPPGAWRESARPTVRSLSSRASASTSTSSLPRKKSTEANFFFGAESTCSPTVRRLLPGSGKALPAAPRANAKERYSRRFGAQLVSSIRWLPMGTHSLLLSVALSPLSLLSPRVSVSCNVFCAPRRGLPDRHDVPNSSATRSLAPRHHRTMQLLLAATAAFPRAEAGGKGIHTVLKATWRVPPACSPLTGTI